MSESSQLTEQIFTNVDEIGAKLETTIDLKSDVLPFMSATLAKIKHLALSRENDPQAQYELFQISTNYLPRTIHAYCTLPIEYRNTRIIKGDKTARQLLIEDLEILKQQVYELEKQFYAGIEQQIQVNSNVVRQKYDSHFQLASQTEAIGEKGFVNQFEFSTYKESDDYKSITFKKQLTKEEAEEQIKKQARKENIKAITNSALDKTKKVGSWGYNTITSATSSIIKKASNNMEYIIGPILILGFLGLVGFLTSSGDSASTKYYKELNRVNAGIHDVMNVIILPTSEFENFARQKKDELTGDSLYRSERISFKISEDKRTLQIYAEDLPKDQCMAFIDSKEEKYDAISLKVNGIDVPENNVRSDYRHKINKNHKLCHLENGNTLTFNFDNQKIHEGTTSPDEVAYREVAEQIDKLNAEYKAAGEIVSGMNTLSEIEKAKEDQAKIREKIAELHTKLQKPIVPINQEKN